MIMSKSKNGKVGVVTPGKIAGKVNAQAIVDKKGYPEVGTFADEKSLQKFYKQMEISQLEDWASLEGLTYKACPDSEPIHRMRVAMAILYHHFPKQPAVSKKKSKYADYTLEQLIQMAIDNDVAVETTEDMRIMRMRVIMGLRAAKLVD